MTSSEAGPARPKKKGSRGPGQARQQARRLAIQALYQHQINPGSVHELLAEFRAYHECEDADLEYFASAVTGVSRESRELDTLFAPLLDRALDDLDPVERAILRLGAWELRERIDVPYRVVIDQGVILAQMFGASESHRYVNAILDTLARQLRRTEVAAGRRPRDPTPG